MIIKHVTNPGNQKLGTLTVELPEPIKGKKRVALVQMTFRGAKLLKKAVNKINNRIAIAVFDFLENGP